MPIRFGIPSLDELIEIPATTARKPRLGATTATLIGPDGCGKSVLALHLASRYAADCFSRIRLSGQPAARLPLVLYVSSDFEVSGAQQVWKNFELGSPNRRQIPFERAVPSLERLRDADLKLTLRPLRPGPEGHDPKGSGSVADFLLQNPHDPADGYQIGFLDLARNTAGDDWNYVNSILGQLESVEVPYVDWSRVHDSPEGDTPVPLKHLVIVDSVAGFETYVGKLDAFGLEQSRRARIAQCMRNATPHCHLLFVVEEPEDGKRLPEEYVTDFVVRVRSRSNDWQVVRTIEIEKARARNHALGEHPFEIRGPEGSSTSEWENADTPRSKNAYVQVFHSLRHRNMLVALDQGRGRSTPNRTVSPFGAFYLDELLSPGALANGRPAADSRSSVEPRGLVSASVSAFVGDTSTGKSVLAEKFIAEGFKTTLLDAVRLFALATGKSASAENKKVLAAVCGRLSASAIGVDGGDTYGPFEEGASLDVLGRTLAGAWEAGEARSKAFLRSAAERMRQSPRDFALAQDPKHEKRLWLERFSDRGERERIFETLRPELPQQARNTPVDDRKWLALINRWARLSGALPRSRSHFRVPVGIAPLVRGFGRQTPAAAARLIVHLFRHPNLRSPGVLLCTNDRGVEDLARHCLQHLTGEIGPVITSLWHGKDPALGDPPLELVQALWHILAEQLIVRRFDIDNATAPAVFHAIQQNIHEAQRLVYGPYFPPRQDNRFPHSDRIRVVLDDFRVLSGLCPSLSEDPAFLPFLTFFLEREGVTTLIVHTDAVRPNVRPVDGATQTLQSLVRQVIMTWSVPFEGQNRIALTVVPAYSSETNGLVRELELSPMPATDLVLGVVPEKSKMVGRGPLSRALVTRNFELYGGIEEGHPRLVPLAVYLFNATERFGAHAEYLNDLFREMFVSISTERGDERRVVWPLSVEEFVTLRDQTHLPLGVQAPYTTVFQVDAFWSLKASGGSLAPQADYLEQSFPKDRSQKSGEDPFGLFQGKPLYPEEEDLALLPPDELADREPLQRRHFFQNSGYASRVVKFDYDTHRKNGMPDRVPLIWDFGFILAKSGPWNRAADERVLAGVPEDHPDNLTVGEVMRRLRDLRKNVSWRQFLGGCKVVAEGAKRHGGTPFVPFDFAAASSETLNSLILEIWLSEIRAVGSDLSNETSKRAVADRLKLLSRRVYQPGEGVSFVELLKAGGSGDGVATQFECFHDDYENWFNRALNKDAKKELARAKERRSLFESLPLGAYCLYRTWLLLLDVLPFESILDPDNEFLLRQKKNEATNAVATRHWYRTACSHPVKDANGARSDEPMLLLRMPGSYSARGDSFLASSSASRSKLLAAHAMDLLCSRRANIERLQMGVGLPVRDILGKAATALPTALRCVMLEPVSPGGPTERLREVTYGELCAHGGRYEDDKDKRPLWLYRSAIKDYDRMNHVFQKWLTKLFHWTIAFREERGIKWQGGFRGYDALNERRFSPLLDYDSFVKFGEKCDLLIAELQASVRHEG
jgi:hypothetical protein